MRTSATHGGTRSDHFRLVALLLITVLLGTASAQQTGLHLVARAATPPPPPEPASFHSFDDAAAVAKQQQQLLLLYFTAKW